MRTFILYDGEGQVIAVVQTESLPEGVKHPFYIEDKAHGAVEVTGDSAAVGQTPAELREGFKFDVTQHKLVNKPVPEGPPPKATA
jgi:hypothetical protein